MNKLIRTAAVFALEIGVLSAWATPTDDLLAMRRARSEPVVDSVWHGDLVKARAYAEANGIPLIAVWSNGEQCGHCKTFEQCVTSPLFRSWLPQSKFVWYFGVCNDGVNWEAPSADGQEGYHGTSFYWCRMKNGSYDPYAAQTWPYVRLYWRDKDGVLKVDEFHSGSWLDGEGITKIPAGSYTQTSRDGWVFDTDRETYNAGARYMIYKLTGIRYGRTLDEIDEKGVGVFSGYVPGSSYSGGEFAFGNIGVTPNAGLEIEYGTSVTNIFLPLSRTNETVRANKATNWIRTVFPNDRALTNAVEWTEGKSSHVEQLRFDPAWLTGSRGYVILELWGMKDSALTKIETSYIKCVTKVENSPKNPLWKDERKADTLKAGEWTMDIDVATNAVRNYVTANPGNKAYTLLLIGGPIWCPDCVRLEEFLINTTEFKTWATNRNVACVAIDEPIVAYNLRYPTLLSHEKFNNISGSSYLCRKGISPSAAEEVLNRNLRYVNNDTDHGGFLRPDDPAKVSRETGGWKTGIPCIVVLRPDGTVMGRVYQFSNKTTGVIDDGKSAPMLVKRLDELLAQDSDRTEEKNDSRISTGALLARRDLKGTASTLSFTDQADYYKIDAAVNTTVYFNLKQTKGYNENCELVLSVIDGSLADPDATPVIAATNTLANGINDFWCELPSGSCYLKVSYPVDAAGYPSTNSYFSIKKTGSTLCHYTIFTDSVQYAPETMERWTIVEPGQEIPEGATNVWISLTAGEKYKFEGVAASAPENWEILSYDASDDTYSLKPDVPSGSKKLTLAVGEGGSVVFNYQNWKPGYITFNPVAVSVSERGNTSEYDFEYKINVRRLGGVSGVAKAVINVDTNLSTKLTGVYEWNDEGKVFAWPEGSNGVQTATVRILSDANADGRKTVYFNLTNAWDSTTPVAENGRVFTLTIEDEDEAVPGRLALIAYENADGLCDIPDSRVIVAKAGSAITLVAQREDGSDGPLMCAVETNGVSMGEMNWAGRDSDVKSCAITLPAYSPNGDNVVKVAIAGRDGAMVRSSAKYLTVRLVPVSSVMFDSGYTLVDSLVRYVQPANRIVLSLNDTTFPAFGTYDLISAAKLSGSVPPGMSWMFDPLEGDGGAIVITGVPRNAGFYTAVFQANVDGEPAGTAQVSINVWDPSAPAVNGDPAKNPYLAVTRTLSDIMVVDDDESAKRLIGLLTVTVPPSGRVSGKYRNLDGKTVTFLSESWSACDAEGNCQAVAAGVLPDDSGYRVTVDCRNNGDVDVDLSLPESETKGHVITVITRNSIWSSANPATIWKGTYNVALPFAKSADSERAFANGDGYVSLRMTDQADVDAGRVKFAGMLPNGRSFSGMSVLESFGLMSAVLPVFCPSEGDDVTAIFDINRHSSLLHQEVGASTVAKPYWRHDEPAVASVTNATTAALSYDGTFDVFGVLYNPDEILGCCTNTFGSQYVFYYALPTNMPVSAQFETQGDVQWDESDVYAIGVAVSRSESGCNISLYDAEHARAHNGLSLSFNRDTGLICGTANLDFYLSRDPVAGTRVTATYRGIVKPWWGTTNFCGSCSDVPLEKSPFVSGSLWFSDRFRYQDNKDRSRELSIKRGCKFNLGFAPGK